jgi:hypothetical protein
MTVSSTTVKNSYSGDGSNDTFVYGFKIFASSDLQVIIRSATGTETTKTLTTDYTVTGVGTASGGNVVFESTAIPTATETVVLIRNVPQTQAIDYIANDPFPAETHEEGLDRATMTIQQMQEEINRSIKLSKTNTMTSTEFAVAAADRANKILAFDSTGEISVTQELGTYKGTDTTVTTVAYVQRDIVKSTSAAQLNNVYICVADSVVGDLLTDTDHFDLLVDAYSAAASEVAAAASAAAAQLSADDAAADLVLTNADVVSTNADVVLTNADVVSTNADAAATAADLVATNQDTIDTAADLVATNQDTIDTAADLVATNQDTIDTAADVVLTHADVLLTNADVVLTHADVVLTNADVVSTGLDKAATNADVLLTAADVISSAASAAAAAASADAFDDVYLGSKSSDPTTDNDGDPLAAGMLYYNTVSTIMRIYSGSAWENVAVSTAGFTTLTGVETLTNKTLTAPKIANGGFVADANGNEQIKFTTTASAVNELTVVNSATSNAPEISSTGGDTDIDLKITPKGSGKIVLDGISFPNADGTADQVLKTDGSGNLSFTDVSGGISWQSSIVTGSTLTAVAGKGYWIDTTSNTCTITLPSSANVGDQLIFSDYARTWNTNKIIIDSNGLNYQGDPDTSTVEYNTNGQSVNIVYSGATKGWIPVSDDDVTDAPIVPPYDIDFLVIAGGASGGNNAAGGGGGAGGYRTSTQTVSVGTAITITVGDGGASIAGSGNGNAGSNSSISGSGLTTITSAGGGYGSSHSSGNGGSGGSGGGAGGGGPQSGGTGNTPSTSPSQGNNGGSGEYVTTRAGGGGGGSSAVGVNGNGSSTPGKAGDGGDGTASSITGSSVTRAGGGGGGMNFPAPNIQGFGGAGGGGDGGLEGSPITSGTAGAVNTGSGGGGGIDGSTSSGAGGKGVVILSMPDASYSTTTTGSPTVDTGVSGKTVLTFTGSGSYTT